MDKRTLNTQENLEEKLSNKEYTILHIGHYRGDIVNELGECGFAFPHAILDPVCIFSLFRGGGKILEDVNHKSPGFRERVG